MTILWQTKRIERAWQLLLGRFERTARKRRWFQVAGFLSNVLLELEWKSVTATHWINDLEDTWTFDLSKTFDLLTIVNDTERASVRYLESKLLHTDMEKVLQLQHQISRVTVSEKRVCLRESLYFSWRLVEACGLNRDAMKLFCKTTQSARVVMTRKSRQKSTVSIVAKETPRSTLTLLTLMPRLTGLYLKLE